MSERTSTLATADEVRDSSAAFPCLTGEQLEQLRPYGRPRTYADGECLWRIGDQRASFHVILTGAVDILQRRAGQGEHLVVRHGPKGFTGDFDLLSDRSAVVEGRACGETEVLEILPEALKELVVADSRLSDVVLGAFIARRQALLAGGIGNTLLIGSRFSPKTLEIREFLERNARPFEWLDLDSDSDAESLLAGFGVEPGETPVTVDSSGRVHRSPSVAAMANAMGLSAVAEDRVYDVVVVGTGPAGLAAAVYASSEGLDVLSVDAIAPGGQASTSSKIENYLGFPTGISGRELAQRAFVQAQKFGTTLAMPRRATRLDCSERPYRVQLDDDLWIRARTVVVASGAQYRRLPAADATDFEGRGVFFGATAMEARLCEGREVIVVGGGNSAGQAAVFLSEHTNHVHVVIRSESLDHSMSRYLISRIESSPRITLHARAEIEALSGGVALERIVLRDRRRGETREMPVAHLFCFIGAVPNTAWLDGCVALDEKGFVRTGLDLARDQLDADLWPARQPFLLETDRPGVFAAGDVRSGSTKRVASAVGEGSICVQFVHQVLAGHG